MLRNSTAKPREADGLLGLHALRLTPSFPSGRGTVLNSEDTSSVANRNLGELGVEPGSALQIGNTFENGGTLAIGKGAGGSGDVGYLYLNDTLGAVTLNGGGKLILGQLANSGADEIQTRGARRAA